MNATGFLSVPEPDDHARRLFDEDIAELGYVMNNSRLWAFQPTLLDGLADLIGQTAETYDLSVRQRGILIAACASTLGDAYCSLAWGAKLAAASDAELAAAVLRGDDTGLGASERAMAGWARKVVRDPNGTSADDVQELRDAGFTDPQIFGITVFVALRLAFSTVDDALGARPDAAYRLTVPPAVLDAVTYGRPIAAPERTGSSEP